MKITGIELNNVRGFDRVDKIDFSTKINVLVGANNAGKSTILKSIYLLQNSQEINRNDIQIGADNGTIGLYFTGGHPPNIISDHQFQKLQMSLKDNTKILISKVGSNGHFSSIGIHEPNNLIYPYWSKRKAVHFVDKINETNTNSVLGNFTNLYSKIDRLVTPQFQPGNKQYVKACNDILGFEVSTLAKGDGKQAVLFIHNQEHIPLTAMGEGVTNILGLITDLCVAEERIFLIEEPENDVHPKALKALLELIGEKSESNQFFISTHSNIVMKHLGAVEGSKIFSITNNRKDIVRPNLRLSSIEEVPDTPRDRQNVLEEMGYDFFDLDLWKAWLFLEESSAEVIIRDYLIRWFVPKLKYELRTFSAGSTSRVKPKFDDFNKLFVFLHLEPTYKNKVWVYIDAGEQEKSIISDMRSTYSTSGWNVNNFDQFSEHDFEKYYPQRFQKKVTKILAIQDKQEKRAEKKELLINLKKWISENDKGAKEEFKVSAAEIITVLKTIRKGINKGT
ncbi:MAG: AAA family ATPase [Cyclobacteriaceae bacterium]|nr:AAA family ATPase [Cyclobacteriaceae bacterium]